MAQFPDGKPLTLTPPPPEPPTVEQDFADQIRVIQKWRKILAVRWLALLALIGAVAIWGAATLDPQPWRFVVAAGYSIGVLIPTLVLYFLRSD